MMTNEKLIEICNVEKIAVEVQQDICWLSVERILRRWRLEKYTLWLITGKIIPEAGQISPALAHNGLMKII